MSDPSPSTSAPGPTRWRPHLVAGFVSLALAVLVTWPLAADPVGRLLGHPGNDSWNHVWGYWWVGEALGRGEWPLHTNLLSYPTGGSLYFIDTVQVLMSFPLQWLGGPALAYNLVILLGLAFSAWAAWLLAFHVTGDAVAAGLALVVYGASPHLLGQAYNGISETVCGGWLPLTLYCLIRVVDRPTWSRGLLLGLAAGMCMLTSWYYGLFAALASTVLMAWSVARQPHVIDWRRTALVLTGAVAIAAVMVLPFLVAFQNSLVAADALVTRDPEFVENSLLMHNITDIAAFFRPSKTGSPDLLLLFGEELIIVIYLGWVGLAAATAAFLSTRRRSELAPWMWLAAVFFVFSLGPYLNVGGEYLQVGGRRVPLPFLVLFEALPVFDRISHPFRFVVGVSLSVGVLGSHGVRHWTRRLPAARRPLVLVALVALVLVEFAVGSPARMPVPTADAGIPAAYVDMAHDPEPGAVLDLPLTVPNLERAIYVWYQAAHGRPVPWGLNDPMPATLLRNRLITTLVRMEASRARSLPPGMPELDLVVGARLLSRQGYRYVVLHERFYPKYKREKAEAVLRGVFGEPVRHPEDGLLVWQVEPVR